ncbi:MAG: YkgJ family cysteine cluster protein [Desulfomonilaceae bacterium]
METHFDKSEWAFFVTALKEEARDILWKVKSSVEPDALVKSVMVELQELGPKSEGQETRTQEEIWNQVRECLLKAAYATRPHCVKCGECCVKGSPVLTVNDIALFESGKLGPKDIFTLRKGEIVYDPRHEKSLPNEEERIKIRETPQDRSCVFYQKWNSECSVYDQRPEQCRFQECWAPKQADCSHSSPLTRRDLLGSAGDIFRIIQEHETRCSHENFSREISRLASTKGQTVENVLEILRFDHHVRDFVVTKLGIGEEVLDLFFGRPLKDFLAYYGLKLHEQGEGTFLLSLADEEPSST